MTTDTAVIPLGQVRSKLGIIAQDPILLSGTLRLNLDIESQYTDEQLYDALHQVQLIRKTPPTGSDVRTENSSIIQLIDARSESDRAVALHGTTPDSLTTSSSSATIVEGSATIANIFSNLDYEIKTGGEKSVAAL
jgi:hypothetical protein